jgi:hypothetical protein
VPIRVPLLLQKAVAVIYPLDISATRAKDPAGEPDTGYSNTFDEVIVYDESNERTTARTEGTAIYVPCQVENLTDERLRQMITGDAPVTNMAFVFHRRNLEKLSLLDANKDVILKKGDRISHLEKYGAPVGTIIKTFADPGLYIYEIRSKSWGFGSDGYDLELVLTTKRREGV